MKAMRLLKKKEGMPFEDFADHLLNGHVQFMRAVPGLLKWTANLAVHGEEQGPYVAPPGPILVIVEEHRVIESRD
jgi:hypothetical protein